MNDSYHNDQGNELREYWQTLLANKYLFAGIFIIIFIFVAVVTKLQTPIYQASSTVLIQQTSYDAQIITISNFTPRNTIINNHIEMLKSRSLLERVVEEIESDKTPDSLNMKRADISRGAKMSRIRANMSIVPVKDTDILTVSYRSQYPFDAYYITGVIARQYYQLNLSMTRGELSEVRMFLEQQTQKVEEELRQTEEKLMQYKEETGIIALSEETGALVNTISKFQEQYQAARIEVNTLEKRLSVLNSNLNEAQKALAEGIVNTSSPLTSKLIESVAMLEADKAQYIAQGYETSHPKIVEIDKKIENLKNQLKEESKKFIVSEGGNYAGLFSQEMISKIIDLRTEVETKKELLSTLGQVINSYEKKLDNIPVKELDLARLERDKRVSEELYLLLKNQYEEYRIAEAGKLGSVRIIDEPVMSRTPILPKTKRNLVLGFFLALIVAGAVVFLKEYFDDSIKKIEDLEKIAKVKVIQSIPRIKVKNGDSQASEQERYRRHLVDDMPEGSAVVESYKMLGTDIKYLTQGKVKSITVSSSVKGEGKSTTVLNLGITLGKLDRSVLIVDTDLRRPVLEKTLGINEKSEGLTQLLRLQAQNGEVDISEYVQKTRYDNVSFLSHGEITMNSTNLLQSPRMEKLIKMLQKNYDYVIYDTPPVLSVADSRVIAKNTDGLLWVVQHKKAKRHDIMNAKKLFDGMELNIIGIVVNNVDPRGVYGSYYYSYYSQYYGKES
ncbi:MAG: polysaccharide biosynthesis tyrosine autokinase [candidate division WOR-3 bacterium]|nr:polysaccharide biosynthesis tyrosine autokinase [candidate division WOR-3 bacterium]